MSERRDRFDQLVLSPLSERGFRLERWEESEGFGDFVAVVGNDDIRVKAVSDRGQLYAVADRGDGWQVPAELEQLVVAAGLEESRRVAGAEGGRASMTERQFRDTLASIREEYYANFLRRLADWAGRQVGLGPPDDPRERT
jgi:hypothetical protein